MRAYAIRPYFFFIYSKLVTRNLQRTSYYLLLITVLHITYYGQTQGLPLHIFSFYLPVMQYYCILIFESYFLNFSYYLLLITFFATSWATSKVEAVPPKS